MCEGPKPQAEAPGQAQCPLISIVYSGIRDGYDRRRVGCQRGELGGEDSDGSADDDRRGARCWRGGGDFQFCVVGGIGRICGAEISGAAAAGGTAGC